MRNSLLLFGIWCPMIYSLHMNNGDIGIAHVEPVLNFRIVGHSEGPDLIEHGHTQPHADEVQITFSAFNQKWDLELLVNHEMFSSKTVFNFSHHEKPELNRILLPDHTLYLTKKGSKPFASVNIYEDGTIHAMILTKNGTYTIDPIHEFPEFDLHSKMAMYHHDDLIHDGLPQNSPISSRKLLQRPNVNDGNPRDYPQGDTNPAANPRAISHDETPLDGAPTKWANCYPGSGPTGQIMEQKFSMGMAVTGEYYAQICAVVPGVANPTQIQKDTACTNHLKNLLADSNTIYVPQMGIHLYIEITDIQTAINTQGPAANLNPPWNMAQQGATNANGGCGETASDTLGKLRAWRAAVHPNDAGLWHLMTTCFPAPGTVGIAYLNAICTARVGSGLSSSLSARTPGSRAIWKVVAHELGHNFGGGHSFELGQGRTGGIMDYGDGKLAGIYQFNSQFRQVPMCQLIAARKANPQTASCFSNYPAANGKQYGYALGAQSPCPSTCLTTPPTQTTRAYDCRECSVAPDAQGRCSTPVVNSAAVADSLCAGNKPPAVSEPCSPAPTQPCAANVCGDGRIGGNEQCDPPGECCDAQCQRITTCVIANDPDACFNSVKTMKTYCFKGAEYNRYNPLVDRLVKEDGFPRKIAEYWPGLPPAFQAGDYDAVIQRKEGRVYFLKGTEYAVFELGFGGHNGYPKLINKAADAINGLFIMPTGWTKVDAAVSLNSGQGGAYVFGTSGNAVQYCRMSFDAGEEANRPDRCPNVNPLTDWNGGQPFPLDKIGAAIRHWPELGALKAELNLAVDLINEGKLVTYTFGDGLNPAQTTLADFGSSSTTTTNVAPVTQSCKQGCLNCDGNVNICLKCDADFQLISGQCYPEEYVVEMLFDSGKYAQDQDYVKETNVLQNDWNSVEGNTNEAVLLKENNYIKLDPKQIDSEMIDWEFHFWINIKPSTQAYQTKSINMVAARLSHGLNKNYELSFFLSPKKGTNFQPVGGEWYPTFRVMKYNSTTGLVDKDESVQSDFVVIQNTWNHLIATLQDGLMKITIDGAVLQVPFDDEADAGQENSVWQFLSFEIGLSSLPSAKGKYDNIAFAGIDGLLDQFHVDALVKTTDKDLDSLATSGSPCKLLFVFIAAIIQIAIYY